MAAARSQPVTPPMRMKSGITRSHALRCKRLVEVAGTVEILADLDRRLELGGKLRVAVEIVVDDRLLDPGQPESSIMWQRRSASSKVRPWLKSAINSMSSPTALRIASIAARSSRGALAAEPEFQSGKTALVAQRDGVVRAVLRRLKPQPVAVIGLHRADRAAEQDAKRHAARLRQRVPRRHVEPGDRDHGLAFISDEMQRLARRLVKLRWRDPASFQHFAEILQRRDQIAHRLDGVGLEIAAPDDAFLGEEVDQDQRPFGDGDDPGDDRTLQLEHDGACADRSECERGQLHGQSPRCAREIRSRARRHSRKRR